MSWNSLGCEIAQLGSSAMNSAIPNTTSGVLTNVHAIPFIVDQRSYAASVMWRAAPDTTSGANNFMYPEFAIYSEQGKQLCTTGTISSAGSAVATAQTTAFTSPVWLEAGFYYAAWFFSTTVPTNTTSGGLMGTGSLTNLGKTRALGLQIGSTVGTTPMATTQTFTAETTFVGIPLIAFWSI
jgi:hypothetical protein